MADGLQDVTRENIMGFWNNITTGKDNHTHDIVRVAISIVTFLFPVLIIWGLVMLSFGWIMGKPTSTIRQFVIAVKSTAVVPQTTAPAAVIVS